MKTDLETLRETLMKQLTKIENGSAIPRETDNIVSVSNAVIKSYNIEVRADELVNNTKDSVAKNKVFGDEA